MLMEKIVLSDDFYLFKPLQVIEGSYLKDSYLFIDQYENSYCDVLNSHIGIGEDGRFALTAIPFDEIFEILNEEEVGMVETIEDQKTSIETVEDIEDQTPIISKNDSSLPFDINEMYKYVTSHVINQDEAVKKIIMTFYLNYLSARSYNIDINPTRCLITGPTGVGKTMIIESILEYLEMFSKIRIPLVKAPTSQLTSAGYVGMNLEDILQELVSKVTNYNSDYAKIQFAERNGVVFFDEIDKKGSPSNNDVAGRGVLNALLQFLDGSNYEVSLNRTKYYLNIFAAGAFTHVNEAVNTTTIGFDSNLGSNSIREAGIKNYIKDGQMPSEFMGRFSQIVKLNSFTIKDLKDILNKSSNSPLLVEKARLQLAGIDFSWDESFIEEIARRASDLNLGARSLKAIIEDSISALRWEALTNPSNKSLKVSKSIMEETKQYTKK